MSLIPFILDLAHEISELKRSVDENIGLSSYEDPKELRRSSATKSLSQISFLPKKWIRFHPYGNECHNRAGLKYHPHQEDLDVSTVGKMGFQACLNVKHFNSNELSVKMIDNCVVVEGKHDDKEDGQGFVSRHFIRKYILPKGLDPNDVTSTLASGILTVEAPLPQKLGKINERIVEILLTGPTTNLPFNEKHKDSFCESNGTTTAVATEPAANINLKDAAAITSPFAILVEEPIRNAVVEERSSPNGVGMTSTTAVGIVEKVLNNNGAVTARCPDADVVAADEFTASVTKSIMECNQNEEKAIAED